MVSGDHPTYLALGGLGFIIGDGALSYGRENILENYYTLHLWRGLYVAPNLQYIASPLTTATAVPRLCLDFDYISNSNNDSFRRAGPCCCPIRGWPTFACLWQVWGGCYLLNTRQRSRSLITLLRDLRPIRIH